MGPVKWTYYYLYVIIDIYSRYTPGWMLAHVERAHLAERLRVSERAFTAAADLGHTDAIYNLWVLLEESGDIEQAEQWRHREDRHTS